MKSNKNLVILKIISIIILLLIFLPSQKFYMPLGLGVFITLLERITEIDFSLDLFLHLVSLLGFVMIFTKKKVFVLLGYLQSSFLLSVYVFYSKGNLDFLFWIPFIFFVVTSIYVIFLEFKKAK